MSDWSGATGNEASKVVLPTRQLNALRILLNRPAFSPQEIAAMDVQIIERAPGVGRKGLQLIALWLESQGYELSDSPTQNLSRSEKQKQRKLQHAIDLLRAAGYEVLHSS